MSVAFDLMPRPDWAATTTVSIAADSPRTPEQWAKAIFDVTSLPAWIKVLLAARALVATAMRLAPGDPAMLEVDRIVGDEAVIDTDDRHLRFVATVRADPGLVHVTTLVTLKGLRGRLYFAPVRLLHDAVTRSMMVAAARRLDAAREVTADSSRLLGRARARNQVDRACCGRSMHANCVARPRLFGQARDRVTDETDEGLGQ